MVSGIEKITEDAIVIKIENSKDVKYLKRLVSYFKKRGKEFYALLAESRADVLTARRYSSVSHA